MVRRLLEINVIHYSTNLEEISNPICMKQGLPIGDGVEGFLANIYLKEVDDAMTKRKVSYGRYVDDIRIFGNSRDEVLKELRVLQEFFLNLGLNLNSSKTQIAEDSKFDWILSSNYDISSGPEPDEIPEAGVQIDSEIDVSFDEFDTRFNIDDDFDPAKNGRDFCKYLSAHEDDKTPIVSLVQRERWHIEYLYRIVVIGRGSIKHAVWLLVQSAIYSGLQESVQLLAQRKMLEILVNPSVCSYAKYRIIHHLTKKRKNGKRFINQLSEEIQKDIADQIPNYISSQAFELNLIALHLLRVEKRPVEAIRQVVAKFANNACEPLKRSLEYIDDRLETIGTAEENVNEDSESLEEY